MTISRQDVNARSGGPGHEGVPLSAAEADRVARVLNQHAHHRPEPRTDANPHELPATQSDQAGVAQPPPAQVLAVITLPGHTTAQIRQAAERLPRQANSHDNRAALTKLPPAAEELLDRLGASL